MTPAEKAWIDGASYETLLRRWRMAAVGDPIFTGETGQYYKTQMQAKREAVGPGKAVRASKAIG